MPDDTRRAPTTPVARRALLIAGALSALTLAGCGQKGDLYFLEDRIEEEKSKRKSSSRGRAKVETA